MNRDLLRDLGAALAAALLVVTAVVVGTAIEHADGTLHVDWPPLYAHWDPHIGPGTPAALAVAVAVVGYGPRVAARLPWRALLAAAWGTAAAWTWSLALIDGWQRGIAGRLTTKYEYLQVIDRFQDIPGTLRGFTGHILIDSPDHWPAHVAGHPPAAPLTFVLLDRIGLGGGAWAGVWCITVGATACLGVLVTVRALAGEELARRAAPFLVLAPAAVWMGTSADGYFAAVAAWAVALLALAATGRRPRTAALGSGLLFGLTCYLSYGLTLFAIVAAAVVILGSAKVWSAGAAAAADTSTTGTGTTGTGTESKATPNRRLHTSLPLLPALPFLLVGLAVVPLLFTLAGFDWWEAYHLLVERYFQGAGGIRPYGYWVWANLACTVLVVGLATAAGLRRAVTTVGAPATDRSRLALLVLAALLMLLVADLSGMSKAETERIWLPFAMWLLPACAFLDRPRPWLAAQATVALLLNHLLLTGW
ncbi:hypothetical protein [Streptomyces sp. NPDC087300]|uniref:hypothetical protein n=1 Tax=Streptomyces sp. NPDC087300 TaxID=3365780 RepID=UPI00381E91C0